MKKNIMLVMGFIVLSIAATAQQVNTDSLTIVSKISDYQLKRAKLQNTVKETTQAKQDAAAKVQTAAAKNSEDASRLNEDPQNKKLAKEADNAASDARSDSKSARNADKKLDNLNKEIATLDDKISKQQQKLRVYTNVAPTMAPMATPAMVPIADTTHRS